MAACSFVLIKLRNGSVHFELFKQDGCKRRTKPHPQLYWWAEPKQRRHKWTQITFLITLIDSKALKKVFTDTWKSKKSTWLCWLCTAWWILKLSQILLLLLGNIFSIISRPERSSITPHISPGSPLPLPTVFNIPEFCRCGSDLRSVVCSKPQCCRWQ